MSAFENMTGLTEAFTIANNLSSGYLAVGFPVVIWASLFGFTLPQGRAQAITAASFITGIILLLENMIGLVPYWVIIANMVLLAVGVVMLLLERRSYEG